MKAKTIQEWFKTATLEQDGVYRDQDGVLCIVIKPEPNCTNPLNNMFFKAKKNKVHGKLVSILNWRDVVEDSYTFDQSVFMDEIHNNVSCYAGDLPGGEGRSGTWSGYRSPIEVLGRKLV